MDAESFVTAVKAHVHDAAVAGVVSTLEHPPGHRPAAQHAALSEWFRSLPETERKRVHRVIALSVHAALFGLLCALDGVRKTSEGEFELFHVDAAGERTRLNAPEAEFLHDIYQSQTFDEIFRPTA